MQVAGRPALPGRFVWSLLDARHRVQEVCLDHARRPSERSSR
jgi:hypothetical protein